MAFNAYEYGEEIRTDFKNLGFDSHDFKERGFAEWGGIERLTEVVPEKLFDINKTSTEKRESKEKLANRYDSFWSVIESELYDLPRGRVNFEDLVKHTPLKKISDAHKKYERASWGFYSGGGGFGCMHGELLIYIAAGSISAGMFTPAIFKLAAHYTQNPEKIGVMGAMGGLACFIAGCLALPIGGSIISGTYDLLTNGRKKRREMKEKAIDSYVKSIDRYIESYNKK